MERLLFWEIANIRKLLEVGFVPKQIIVTNKVGDKLQQANHWQNNSRR